MLTRLILIISLTISPFLQASASDDCTALSWKSKRISNSSVSVQGVLSLPAQRISIEVWRHDELIGTSTVRSNARGHFLSTVYTNRKPYKNSNIVISCYR